MRRIRFTLSGVVRADDEGGAERSIREALSGIRVFGFALETEDLGPVESVAVQPDAVIMRQGTR